MCVHACMGVPVPFPKCVGLSWSQLRFWKDRDSWTLCMVCWHSWFKPPTCASRASDITEIVFCGLTSRRSTGLSSSPETQTLLVLIQYSQYFGNCKDRSPLSNLDSNQRKQATSFFPFHFPLMYESYSATFNLASLTEAVPVVGCKLTRHPWQNFSL